MLVYSTEAFEDSEQLCCGLKNKTLMTKLSPDHKCCVKTQYNEKLESCCEEDYPMVQVKAIRGNETHRCGKNPNL